MEKKTVIELQNVKRDFIVGDETVHCEASRSKYTKESSSQ